jgi:hypothetical protein
METPAGRHDGRLERGLVRKIWYAKLSYYPSLMAIMSAEKVYSQLNNAKVSLKVIGRPIHLANWVPTISSHYKFEVNHKEQKVDFPSYQAFELDRAQTFACISYFESGTIDVEPGSLSQVMAMSSGNSLFVAKPLLSDPGETFQSHEVKRVVGNVGRAGIAMLIPPQKPRIRQAELDRWNVVNHKDFVGKAEDCFNNTSMHLSFTGYEIPINVGSHGLQDTEAFLLETDISVHDRGKWVADLDVLGMLEGRGSSRLRRADHLSCDDDRSYDKDLIKLAAIDNWDELLDGPSRGGVVRAHGNWTGRLAATATALEKGHTVCVITGHPCWKCMARTQRKVNRDLDELTDIIVY